MVFLARYRVRVGLVVGVLALIFLIQFEPSALLMEGWGGKVAGFVGLALVFLGVVGRLWATTSIGGRKTSSLVVDGPYSLCRNPLYLFSLSLFLGLGLRSGNLYFLALLALYFPIQYSITVTSEESTLGDAFGQDYIAYKKRVPLLWPSGTFVVGEPYASPKSVLIREAKGMAFAVLALVLIDGLAGRL